MGVWNDPHSARGQRYDGAPDPDSDPDSEPMADGSRATGTILYLHPTDIAEAAHRYTIVVTVTEATDPDAGLLWSFVAQPVGTDAPEDCVTVRYTRRVGHPCPVRVSDLVLVPNASS